VKAMRRFKGIGACDGIVIGPAHMLAAKVIVLDRCIPRERVQDELIRLAESIESTDQRLAVLGQDLAQREEHEGNHLLECHRLILKSGQIADQSNKLIRGECFSAESAVRQVVDTMAATLDKLSDPYFQERVEDIQAVGDQLLRTILGLSESSLSVFTKGAIGVGCTLSPIDALRLSRMGFAGIVTERGGKTSHAAIILRGLALPYVPGIRDLCDHVRPEDTLIVDGGRGEVIANPDHETLILFQKRRDAKIGRTRKLLRASQTQPTVTADGVGIEIGANIERLVEVRTAVDLGAKSIGLLRTEFLYLNCPQLPTEEEQYRDAVAALTALGGRMATFRTLDIGGEKLPPCVRIPGGPNPSLGVRAIRFSLRRPDIFRVQLRALYRASAAGPMRIMFPLISSVAELCAARQVCESVQEELEREGVPYSRHVPIGAMIETPSAALTIDHLAKSCDFFSIGTNDLIQYAFAADRDNHDVAHLCRALHPAVVRLLKHAIDAANFANKPIAVCGDIAGDSAFTWVLLGLGVRELSMSPCDIPAVRSVILATRLSEAEEMVAEALELESAREVEDLVMGTMRRRFPLELAVERAEPKAHRHHFHRQIHPPIVATVRREAGSALETVSQHGGRRG